jgi:rsbT co-antagonist protein RsbR
VPHTTPSPSAQTRETIEFLSLAAAQLAGVRDLPTLATTLHGIMRQVIAVEFSGIYFLDPGSGNLRLYEAHGFGEAERQEAERTAMERHPGRVLRSGQRIHVPDVLADPQQQTKDSPRNFIVRARLFLPVTSEGRCIGTIGLASAQRNHFSELHVSVLDFCCQVAGVVYKNVNDNSELSRQLDRIRQQEFELRRLSSPVIEVWDRVLALPLIGSMNSRRFELIAENLLTSIVSKRARLVILDLTGLENLEDESTRQLMRLYRAIELLGSKCLLSGISPAIARGLAVSSDSLSHLRTFSTLSQALAWSLRQGR